MSAKHELLDNETAAQDRPMKRVAVESQDLYCFGMLVDFPCKITSGSDGQATPIDLDINDDLHTVVYSGSRVTFGTLEQTAQKIMAVIRKELYFQMFADTIAMPAIDAVSPRNTRLKVPRAGARLGLYVILYGSPRNCTAVGEFAARSRLYLQHPQNSRLNVPYLNPHCLPSESLETVYTHKIECGTISESATAARDFQNPIDLFADSDDQDTLEAALSPQALRTDLYTHQKQALTFMLRREIGWALDGHLKDIWKKETEASGRVVYVNTVSGQRQIRPPSDFRGGLLIDAPGLGKSLSIISLILSTKERRSLRHVRICMASRSDSRLMVNLIVIQTWTDELKRHLKSSDALTFCVYYGKDRTKYLRELERYCLVITTYSVTRSDWQSSRSEKYGQRTLHDVDWGRIVLDEAHIIREPTKSFSRSVCALKAERRWGVTGTPIQNRLTDLFSLFKFLRCAPFNDLRVFNAHVTQNWRARSDPVSVAKLKTLVNCISLRRPKTTVKLPHRYDQTVYLDFNEPERRYHDRIRTTTRSKLYDAYQLGSSMNFINALQWVNELRLICNHGITNIKATSILTDVSQRLSKWNPHEAQMVFDQLDDAGLAKCSNPECFEDLTSALSSETDTQNIDEPRIEQSLELLCFSCFHARENKPAGFLKVCNHLPRCSSQSPADDDPPPLSDRLYTGNDTPCKVQRLLEDLSNSPEGIKSVVFSCWTKSFDIIQPKLMDKSIRCVRLDGSLSATRRANVVRTFRTDPDIKVLLATITCGGVGLDLTAASRAYIIEPQWNPMSEAQALDRIHRLGQEKEVMTIRYVIKDSWEEQVLKLQARKQDLADLTLSGGAITKAELNSGRLQYLKELVG
ncbi:alpha-1,6-mannosyltransferase [Lambiella insularis]|nr:alpha-1,6-mannosyltransferase [Lambiella insularis]